MKAIWMAAAATLFLCGTAWAQVLPRYEIEADCREMYKGDASGYDHCIDIEQEHYDTLKDMWASVPPEAKRSCVEMMDPDEPSYLDLLNCVEIELGTFPMSKKFKY